MTAVDARTRVCILVGDPVEHSYSPLIHNAAFKAAGLNFVYVAFPVKERELEAAIEGIRAFNIRGASITIPHKVKAMNYIGHIDPIAQKIGSINTIVNENGELKGFNSDGLGALKALQDYGVSLEGKRVLILGSGGAARGIVFTLAMNVRLRKLSVLGILPDELSTLIDSLRPVTQAHVVGEVLNGKTLQKQMLTSEIVINCTPVGMYPNTEESPVPKDVLRKGLLVFDVVYNPLQTKLLTEAKTMGCDTISGIEMFINQAVVQFELWTGVKAPEEVMRAVILKQVSGEGH